MPRLTVAPPSPGDGAGMWRLARECGLEPNSAYKYLLFCRDFAATSAVATLDGEPAGFVTGYRRPQSDTLFVWQIAVAARHRKRGVALSMLRELHGRPGRAYPYLEATVTPSNTASRRLFETFAEVTGGPLETEILFPADLFPDSHEPEVLVKIGPIPLGDRGVSTTEREDRKS